VFNVYGNAGPTCKQEDGYRIHGCKTGRYDSMCGNKFSAEMSVTEKLLILVLCITPCLRYSRYSFKAFQEKLQLFSKLQKPCLENRQTDCKSVSFQMCATVVEAMFKWMGKKPLLNMVYSKYM
jgi:hypothetical protein